LKIGNGHGERDRRDGRGRARGRQERSGTAATCGEDDEKESEDAASHRYPLSREGGVTRLHSKATRLCASRASRWRDRAGISPASLRRAVIQLARGVYDATWRTDAGGAAATRSDCSTEASTSTPSISRGPGRLKCDAPSTA